MDNPYPEHEKVKAVAEKSQVIGEFLDYLASKGITLCDWDEPSWHFLEIPGSTEQRLADYFGIDLSKVEAERRHMLEMLRHAHK